MEQHELNNYFKLHWNGYNNIYKYSGFSIIDKIKCNEWVIDVGCGKNIFKPFIKNLVGIDPVFGEADFQTTIEEFITTQSFDVALCFGSINFGSEQKIKNQINCVVRLLSPTSRIYWRVNPGRKDHGNEQCKNIDFFPWNENLLKSYAEEFGFDVVEIKEDNNKRIYCEWSRSNT